MSKLFPKSGGRPVNIGQLLGKPVSVVEHIQKAYSLVLSIPTFDKVIDISDPGDSISKQYDLTLSIPSFTKPNTGDGSLAISSPGSSISKQYELTLGIPTFENDVSIIVPFDPDMVVLHDDDLLLDTDYTTEALNMTQDDVPCFPTGGGAVGDGLYVGNATQWHTLEMWLTTLGVGTYTITLKYWNGSTWTVLSNIWNNIANWQGVTWIWQKFTIPGDWATTTILSTTLYWIKFEVTAYTTCSTTPLLAWIQIDDT